jgi:hypothetical protein
MRKVIGHAGSFNVCLETNLVGKNLLFMDLDGGSYDVAAANGVQAVKFAAQLRSLANKIDRIAHKVGTLNVGVIK